MCLRPSASMPTTPPCWFWRRVRRAQDDYGLTCVTTCRSPAQIRRPRRSSIRPTAAARIPKAIWLTTRALQADAYAGFNRLYEASRKGGPIVEAACWAHARRKFFDLARLQKAPIAIAAVERIDALFAIEREINGMMPQQRLAVRNERSRPLIAELETWLRTQRGKLSRRSETAKAIDYSLKRWLALTRFLADGRLCISNNAAERALRGIAVGRHNWTFAGSDEGARRAAAVYTLIETAKLNGIDPQAWLADVLARLPDHPMRRVGELLPWQWCGSCRQAA